jgi:hypothetical protein
VAWVADRARADLEPLVDWLGVNQVVTHAATDLTDVAILDLPDVDSVRIEHRATVDALLPRIDVVAWVVDPEKYDDARLHAYLRELAPHAARLRFILNKADRLTESQQAELVEDLRRRLSVSGIGEARIDVVSAASGMGVPELRAALAREADAKALVSAKLVTDAVEARRRLARAVGLDPAEYRPLISDERRVETTRASVDGALALVDPSGVARQVQLAVLGRARRSGGSLLGRAVALLGWMTGQTRRSADPVAYLRDWRRRGSLGRSVNPVYAALVEAASLVPGTTRPIVSAALRADELEAAITKGIDRATSDASADVRIGGSVLWPVIGVIQLGIGAIFLFAVAWYVTLWVSQGVLPVATFDAPLLGPVPLPLSLLAGSIVASAIIGLLLSLHAGWIGRRLGARVADRVRSAVAESVEEAGFAGVDRVERARRTIGGMT